MSTPTLAELGKQAKAEAQRLLDVAHAALATAENALSEAAATPIFGNGLASRMAEVRGGTDRLRTQVQGLKTAVENYDRPDVPDATKGRAEAMRRPQ